ncbi:MAG: WbqC family protein [Candidatus Melainabacteria bacterium]
MTTVAICQSNYIPWKGYFDLIARADAFVLLDDVQYTRRDWRNRNQILTVGGLQWLTISVASKGHYTDRIDEIRISEPQWAADHWKTLTHVYGKADGFAWMADEMADLYTALAAEPLLCRVNHALLAVLLRRLAIATPVHHASDLDPLSTEIAGREKSGRLLRLCQKLKATRYLSGPAAKAYLDVAAFETAGIAVEWMTYDHYPAYPQLHRPEGETCVHTVSVLDLLFNLGPDAAYYLRNAAMASTTR